MNLIMLSNISGNTIRYPEIICFIALFLFLLFLYGLLFRYATSSKKNKASKEIEAIFRETKKIRKK